MRENNTPRTGPLAELTKARFLEFVRDPSALFWVFVFPVLLAVVLGIAFRNRGPEKIQVAVLGPEAQALLARVGPGKPAGDVQPLTITPMDPEQALVALRSGRIDLVVKVDPPQGDSPSVTYRYDPTRPGARTARLTVDDFVQQAYGRTDAVQVVEEKVEEKGGRYIDFLVPGLIGLNVMGSCMWGMGYAIVDSRRRKLLKRFAVTPMNRSHFLLSFALSRLVFLVLEVGVLVTFGHLVFDVRVHGPVSALALAALMGTAAFSGLSLLIASRTSSTEVASGWMNFIQLPMWLLSGSFFAYSRFPEFLHPWIRLLPLTALNDAARAVMNEGSGFESIGGELAVLAVWAVLSFIAALKIFRWQ